MKHRARRGTIDNGCLVLSGIRICCIDGIRGVVAALLFAAASHFDADAGPLTLFLGVRFAHVFLQTEIQTKMSFEKFRNWKDVVFNVKLMIFGTEWKKNLGKINQLTVPQSYSCSRTLCIGDRRECSCGSCSGISTDRRNRKLGRPGVFSL